MPYINTIDINGTTYHLKNLTDGDYVVDLPELNKNDIFVIMGASGCGKSTLLSVLTGLKEPDSGSVFIDGYDFWHSDKEVKDLIMRKCGILYQSGALFSSMTLAENVALPLQQYTDYSQSEIDDLVS